MALPKVTDPVNNITNQPVKPVIGASALQALFDEIGKDLKVYLNDSLTVALESTTDGNSGLDNIGMTQIPGLTATTPQQALEELKALSPINIADGSITESKISFFVKPTGTGDDTVFLQNAIDSNNIIIFRKGNYYLQADSVFSLGSSLQIGSNKMLIWQEGAIFNLIPTNSQYYRMLDLRSNENITLVNPRLVGDKDTHLGTTGEFGHGIYLDRINGVDCKNIKIINPICNKMWGDGISIYGAENVVIENAKCDDNRRQGITISSGINLHINGAYISNTGGINPQAGIDIEPSVSTQELKGVFIKDVVTENNAGSGISINLEQISTTDHDVNIVIENCKDFGSTHGFYITKLKENVSSRMTGEIKIINFYSQNADQNGIWINDCASGKTANLIIDKPTIINPNVSGQASSKYGSAISITRENSATSTYVLGNFVIIEPTIIDNRNTPKIVNGLSLVDEKNVGYSNAKLLNPLRMEGLPYLTKVKLFSSGLKIRDNFEVIDYIYNVALGTNVTIGEFATTLVTNDNALAAIRYNLNRTLLNDAPITFVNKKAQGIFVAPVGGKLYPISTVAGKYIASGEIGASVTLRQINATDYYVEKIVGQWTVEP